jgi:serine/threonine-protein kinase
MRICPSCQRSSPGAEIACPGCGTALVDDVSMSDTSPASALALAPEPAPDPLAVELAGKYEIVRKVGQGGMGAVYEARHTKIGKRVAIKVLLDKYVQKADVVARLIQEARLASSIGHENIIDITDVGETTDGRTFVVMEFLEGESLHALLVREGSLAPARALPIIRQVASALGAAHGKGVVHRDVKPENVFIIRRADKEFVKVVDFGISKAVKPEHDPDAASSPRLTATGMVLGTPLYLSPEQARGEDDLDHRIDVYALGVVLYETLTGEVPFHGANYLAIISQILASDPTPPSAVRTDLPLSPDIDAVVGKAMAKDRAVRYQSMAELDADLARLESGAHPRAHTEREARPRRWVTIAGWAGVVAGIAAAVALVVPRLLGGEEPRPEPPPPEVTTVPVPLAQPPPPLPTTIHVGVTSLPPGAEVLMGDVSRGRTPITLEVPRGDDPVALLLRHEQFVDAPASFTPTRDQEVVVTLTRKPPAPRPVRRPAPRPAPKPPDRGPTSGGEIKASPYGPK